MTWHTFLPFIWTKMRVALRCASTLKLYEATSCRAIRARPASRAEIATNRHFAGSWLLHFSEYSNSPPAVISDRDAWLQGQQETVPHDCAQILKRVREASVRRQPARRVSSRKAASIAMASPRRRALAKPSSAADFHATQFRPGSRYRGRVASPGARGRNSRRLPAASAAFQTLSARISCHAHPGLALHVRCPSEFPRAALASSVRVHGERATDCLRRPIIRPGSQRCNRSVRAVHAVLV